MTGRIAIQLGLADERVDPLPEDEIEAREVLVCRLHGRYPANRAIAHDLLSVQNKERTWIQLCSFDRT